MVLLTNKYVCCGPRSLSINIPDKAQNNQGKENNTSWSLITIFSWASPKSNIHNFKIITKLIINLLNASVVGKISWINIHQTWTEAWGKILFFPPKSLKEIKISAREYWIARDRNKCYLYSRSVFFCFPKKVSVLLNKWQTINSFSFHRNNINHRKAHLHVYAFLFNTFISHFSLYSGAPKVAWNTLK